MILAIDQGTTGTTCLVVDDDLRVLGRGYRELPQRFPRPGWVEQDPEEIWLSVERAAEAHSRRGSTRRPEPIGITNQRETTVLWDRATGEAVAPAIVWQDRRTAERCRELDAALIRERTGLVPDPYFSATKLEWLLREHGRGGLAFGTVDAWLVWKLTGGERHVTDVTNASRTMLVLARDARLGRRAAGAVRRRPRAAAARSSRRPRASARASCSARASSCAGSRATSRRRSTARAATAPGEGKATYGTGSFVLVHTGEDAIAAAARAAQDRAADGYALEGAVLVSGAAVQWLRDGLGLLGDAAESEALARSVDSTEGVVFVPALTGLGSPWWDADARGLIAGITRGTTRAHLVRAALEAIAHQVADVVDALPEPPAVLRADGGATANGFLMQLQADLLGVPVEVAAERETTALGAAALAAGRGARVAVGATYEPRLSRDEAASAARPGAARR